MGGGQVMVQVMVSQQGAAQTKRTWPSGQNRANWLPLLSLTTAGWRAQIISHTETDRFIISVNASFSAFSQLSERALNTTVLRPVENVKLCGTVLFLPVAVALLRTNIIPVRALKCWRCL